MNIKNRLKRIIPSRLWNFCRAYLKWDFSPSKIHVSCWPKHVFEKYVMDTYEREMGYSFDVNKPTTFTEKMQWYKLYYPDNGISLLTDKITFKTYIEKTLGSKYVIPMIGHWDKIDAFVEDWKALPQSFVLKSNVGAGGGSVKIIRDKNTVDFDLLVNELKEWLNPLNPSLMSNMTEYRFNNSIPRILAEQLITIGNNILSDYKLFCFDGKPYYAYKATKKQTIADEHAITFYDLNWTKLDVSYGTHPTCDNEKPIHWEEMKEIAAKLSKGFPMVRVDFFDTEDQLFLAEMTFNPGGGYVPYFPESFNKAMGDQFKVPTNVKNLAIKKQ